MSALISCFISLPGTEQTKNEHHRYTVAKSASPCSKRGLSVKCSIQKNTVISVKPEVTRPPSTAIHFQDSVWKGYDFSSSLLKPDISNGEGRLEELKDEVKNMLCMVSNDPYQEIDIIDKIQRLGLAYHFEHEIQNILLRIYNEDYTKFTIDNENRADISHVALRFRILRQAGYFVSPAVFHKFIDEKKKFHAEIACDVHGMLNLYEASYVSLNGEDILEEAKVFTTKHLSSIATSLNSSLKLLVQRALKVPLQKGQERIQARHYIAYYQSDKSRNDTLLRFAKLDYNAVQSIYREEISELSRWWEGLNLQSKLPFNIRDRVVEAYSMIIGYKFEPEFSQGRIHLAKMFCIWTVLDDAHDVYGNIDELRPLCEAFQRWDATNVVGLADHMKVLFDELFNLCNEIETDVNEIGHFVGMPYFIQETQVYTNALFEEVQTLFSTDLPTLEDWLRIAIVTITFKPFLIAAVMNMGEVAKKEVFDWIISMPRIVKLTYVIDRLLDDIASLKVEEDRGVTASSITCYMKDHGVSKSEAIERIYEVIEGLWKDLNQESLRVNNPVPMSIIKLILNTTRNIIEFSTDGDDGYTTPNGSTVGIVASLIVDPIPL